MLQGESRQKHLDCGFSFTISFVFAGMKIITQGVPGSTSKILPKPSQISTPSGTPVVVVSAGSSQSSSVAMVTRTGSSVSGYYFLCCFLLQFNSININFVYPSTSAHLKVVNLRS